MQTFRLYYHTLKHLRPVQIYGRLWFHSYRPRPNMGPAPPRRPTAGVPLIPTCPRPPSLTGPNEFTFLNERAAVTKPEDWDSPSFSKLWLYNLHYFDDLNAEEADRRSSWHRDLLRRWMAENPPGSGTGWEPYPTSLRIVNWIKWMLRGQDPVAGMLDSLAAQTKWLNKRLEYHLLGNHLLANAKALVFAGLFFQGPEAERFYSKGMRILARELREQILADGGHFERSPMYHLIVLEDLLDLINLHHVYGEPCPEDWPETAGRMEDWSEVMRHPDGGIPLFNDAASGVAPGPKDLDEYAQRLAIRTAAESERGVREGERSVRHLKDSGYVCIEEGSAVLLADVGSVGPDYLPGHAHAGTLSFELSLGGQRVIVNSGVSEYAEGPERLRQRSTAAHSTVVLDGENSSEVWGGFRVARRAHVTDFTIRNTKDCCEIGATHNGYQHLPGKPLHRRRWQLTHNTLLVEDEIHTQGHHTVGSYLRLPPDLNVELAGPYRAQLSTGEQEAELAGIQWWPEGRLQVEETSWHPMFNHSVPSLVCVFRMEASSASSAPLRFGFQIQWP